MDREHGSRRSRSPVEHGKGQVFKTLVEQGVQHRLRQLDTAHDPKSPAHERATDALATLRDEARRHYQPGGQKEGTGVIYDIGDAFNAIVDSRVARLRKQQEQERQDREDLKAVREELQKLMPDKRDEIARATLPERDEYGFPSVPTGRRRGW